MVPPRLALVLTSSVIAIWLAPAAAVTDSGHTAAGAYGTVLADLDGAKGPPSPARGGAVSYTHLTLPTILLV